MTVHKLVVPIVADSTAFKRGLKESETAAQQFETKIKGTAAHARSHLVLMGGALVGAGGLVEGLKNSFEAGVYLDQATSQLNAQMKANHETVKAYSSGINKMNSQLERVGFTNAESEEAMARLSRAAGNSSVALKYMGLTADLAAAKHVSLSAAALVVGKVIQGSTTALNRYGIIIPKGTSATEALALAQSKVAGQAKAMAKPTEVISDIITDFEARIGKALIPTIDKYTSKLSAWLGVAANQKKVTDAVTEATRVLGTILSTLHKTFDAIWPAIVKVKNAFGDWKPVIVATGAALVALGLLSPWTALAVGAVYVITHWEKVKGWFEQFGDWLTTKFRVELDVIKGLFYGWVASSVLALKLLADGAAKALGWLPGIGGKLKDAARSIDGFFSYFKNKSQDAFADIGKSDAETWADNLVHGMTKAQARIAAAAGGGSSVSGATSDSPGRSSTRDTTTGAGRLSNTQIQSLWIQAGGSRALAPTMAAIALAESGGRVSALNDNPSTGDYSAGLWQTNYFGSLRGPRTRAYGSPDALRSDPLAAARSAVGIQASQGLSAWSTYTSGAYRSHLMSGSPPPPGALPGDAKAAAAAAKAQDAAAKKAASAAKAAAAAAYKSWKENYFTPLDNQYKSDLLVTDEAKRLNKLEALHAKLAIDLKGATGKEHQDLLNEENKVQSKIQSLRVKMSNERKALLAKEHAAYVAGLQADLASAQTALARQQTLFDRAFGRIANKLTAGLQAKYAAATPEEQARDAFQAQLDAARNAAELGSAKSDLVAAQLAGDKVGVQQAQARLDDIQNQQKLSDLQAAADKSRAIRNAEGDEALANLNDWLADQKTALEGGTQTWDGFWKAAFSDAPSKYAPDAVSSLQGVIDQMRAIQSLQAQIDGGGSATSAGGGLTSGLGGATGFRLLNPLPHFGAGGVMPGAYGQPGLAVLHGGETVIPNGGGGGDVHIYLSLPNYVGDKREVAQLVRTEFVKAVRSGTKLGF